ncbi:hypothetical protein N431DRAFT_470886 [Stipitochalara longipes BDJ]|nr:hypothetical protein N431DRAFT_470886 [Stipitochalara longipes BDJ]
MAAQNIAQELSRSTEATVEATNQTKQSYPVDTPNPSLVAVTLPLDRTELDAQNGGQNKDKSSRETTDSRPEVNAASCSTGEPKISEDDSSSSDKLVSQEDLLKAIYDKLPSAEMLSGLTQNQLEILIVIAERLKYLEETKVEFIWSSVLQLAGLLFVVIFGVFAALAYDAAEIASRQSAEANQMSLMTFCMLNPNIAGELCAAVSQQGSGSLTSLATAILGTTAVLTTTPSSSSTQTITSISNSGTESPTLSVTLTVSATPINPPSQTPSNPGSSHHLNTPALVGTIVGVVLGLLSVVVSSYAFFVRFRRARIVSKESSLVDYDRSREYRVFRGSEGP